MSKGTAKGLRSAVPPTEAPATLAVSLSDISFKGLVVLTLLNIRDCSPKKHGSGP